MKAKEIQDLIDFISKSGLAEVNIETEQFKIAVKKHNEAPVRAEVQQVAAPAPQAPAAPAPSPSPSSKAEPEAPKSSEGNLITIKSPMIGTFYRSSSPDTPPFVNIGDEVKPGKTVCIIEAMKLFNEIESEVSGKIVKVLVENASPVEYDQPLFLVEP
ncbi:acetyl-CoA carboxylase biotin carboxyl carrier protein [Cytophagaceae bacterium ABcell3]|nr:acetyl-CoA carboxylase biotin carboxyl carrier protein [Cytophagaceae bacterium ABcell3]